MVLCSFYRKKKFEEIPENPEWHLITAWPGFTSFSYSFFFFFSEMKIQENLTELCESFGFSVVLATFLCHTQSITFGWQKKKKNSEQNVGFVLLRFSHWEFRGNSGCTGSLESWKCRNLQSLKEWVDLGFFLPRQKRTGHSLCQYCCLPVDPWDSGRTHLAKHHSIPNRKFSRHFSPEKVKIKKDTQHSPALPQAERHLDPSECVPLASSNSCWKEPIFSFPNRQKQRQNKTSSLRASSHTLSAHSRGCPQSSAKCHCQGSFSTTQTSFPAFQVGVFGPSQAPPSPTGAVELYWGLCSQNPRGAFR